MGKYSFAATSLVSALPAGLLAFAVVYFGFIKNSENLSAKLPLMVFSVLVLGVSAFVALVPFGIMVFGGARKRKVAAGAAAGELSDDASVVSAAEVSEAELDDMQTSGEAQIVDSDADAAAFDDDEIDATTAFNTPASGTNLDDSGEIMDADSDEFADLESISDEVILEDDEDDTPKKKRR